MGGFILISKNLGVSSSQAGSPVIVRKDSEAQPLPQASVPLAHPPLLGLLRNFELFSPLGVVSCHWSQAGATMLGLSHTPNYS